MYSKEEIIAKIQSGLKACYAQNIGDRMLMNVKISISRGLIPALDSAKCEWMEGSRKVGAIKIPDLFNVNPIEGKLVSGYLCKTLKSLAAKEKIQEAQISAKMYSHRDDYYPSVNLFNGDNLVREITVEELVEVKSKKK